MNASKRFQETLLFLTVQDIYDENDDSCSKSIVPWRREGDWILEGCISVIISRESSQIQVNGDSTRTQASSEYQCRKLCIQCKINKIAWSAQKESATVSVYCYYDSL